MPREMLSDGTYREMTWEEVLERGGEEAVRDLQTPATPLSEMTEGERALAERMQAEFELSAALRERGQTIDDVVPGFSLKRPEAAGEGSASAEAPAGETDGEGR